jgi:hypothetical protein
MRIGQALSQSILVSLLFGKLLLDQQQQALMMSVVVK